MVLNINNPNFSAELPSGYTLTELVDFIKLRFEACGFPSPSAELGGLDHKIGYELVLNPVSNYGTVKFIVEVSMLGAAVTMRARLYHKDNYDFTFFTETATTGANNTTGASMTLINTSPLAVYSVPNDQEIFGCLFVEGVHTFKGFLGILYPSNVESWYDENQYVLAQLVNPTKPNETWLPYPNPLNTNASTAVICRFIQYVFSTRNPIDQKAQIIAGPYVTFYTWGIGAKLNQNMGISNNSGFFANDIAIVTTEVEEWWTLYSGDNGIVLRSV